MNKFVVVDLETTGNNNRGQDRIIQIAAFLLENGEVIEQFSSFINPNMNIPTFISELTGISDEMDAPTSQVGHLILFCFSWHIEGFALVAWMELH